MAPESPAAAPCQRLAWDSELWGFPVGQVRSNTMAPDDLREIDRWCEERSISCLYFLAAVDDLTTVRTAEDGGFRFSDVRVTLSRTPERLAHAARPADPAEISLRPSRASDLHPLQRIAAVSHRDTRFFCDQYFPRAKCETLYERWIANSCSGYADMVIVGEAAGEPVGYITCHLPSVGEQAGRIGLLGVAPTARGRGLGRALVRHALDWFTAQQVERVTVVTQGRNIAAQALYQRCGFVTCLQQLWFHKWYLPPDRGSLVP